jgi:hypothetical protein
MFLSNIFLLSLVVTLRIYNGKAIFDWHGLTLNTVVAILSTGLRALLLYAVAEAIGQWKWILFNGCYRPLIEFDETDNASRGVWGSILLFCPSFEPRWPFLRMGMSDRAT